jgi:hypothetical protein
MPAVPADLRGQLIRYEVALALRDPTGIDGGLMSLIAADFVEFGRSGRIWDRDSIRSLLEGPAVESTSIDFVADRFEVAELLDGVALVTYRSPRVNRSSIWLRRGGRWQLRFHQGTAVP